MSGTDGIIALIIVIVFGIIVGKGMGVLAARTTKRKAKRRHNKWHG